MINDLKAWRVENWFGLEGSNILYVVSAFWCLGLFICWDLLQWFMLDVPPYGLSWDPFSKVSLEVSWLHLSEEISRGIFFPITPALEQSNSGFSMYPYLTLWIHGLLISIFGTAWASVIGGLTFGVATFLLQIAIYRHYLPWRWSVGLAALGHLVISSFPIREFLWAMINGEQMVSMAKPDLISFPIPSISLFAFLGMFFLSIQRRRLSMTRILLITTGWALQSQIHIVNAVLGLSFWLMFLPVMLWRQNGSEWDVVVTKKFITNVVLAVVVCLPSVLVLNKTLGFDTVSSSVSDGAVYAEVGLYLIKYAAVPLLLVYLVYRYDRVDPFELTFKFLPIWTLMFSEFLVIALWVTTGVGLPPQVIFSRIGIPFIHLYPFVPILYYVVRPSLPGRLEPKRNIVLDYLGSGLHHLGGPSSRFLLPVFFVFITSYIGISAFQAFHQTSSIRAPILKTSSAQIELVIDGAPEGTTLVVPSLGATLQLPLEGKFGTLVANRFANRIDEETSIERIALYARMMGWSEQAFTDFMAPGKFLGSTDMSQVVKLSGTGNPTQGFGYWLTYLDGVRHEDATAGKKFEQQMKTVFREMQVADALQRFRVSRALIPEEVAAKAIWVDQAKKVQETDYGVLLCFTLTSTAGICHE